jgi:hypothetical protein
LVPVRKGRGLEGEKKETEVGVKVARALVPIRAKVSLPAPPDIVTALAFEPAA